MSSRRRKNKLANDPSEAGLSFLSGKSLDKCFLEVLRAIVFGLGGCRADGLPFKPEPLFEFACKTFHVQHQHAQNLLQQVTSEVPEQALNVQVIEAENVADVSAGANTCVKLAVVPLQNPVRPGDADDTDGCPETELQMNDVNPHYNTEFTFDLDKVDDMGLLVEIWAYPDAGKTEPKQEETGMLSRLFKRLTTTSSSVVEEGILATLLIPLHHIHPAGVSTWYRLKSRYGIETRCKLQLSFVADKGCPEGWNDDNRDEELSQYRSLARVFLMHQLEESQQKFSIISALSSTPWYHWSFEAEDILTHFGQQHHLTRLQQKALTVEAVAQMNSCRSMPHEALIHFCRQLIDTYNSMDDITASEETSVRHALNDVINFIFGRFSVSAELFPPRSNETLEAISAFVDMLLGLQKSAAWSRCLPDKSMDSLTQQAKLTMQVRIKAWYLASVEFSMGFCKDLSGLATISQKMSTVIASFLVAVETASKAYSDILSGFGLTYSELCIRHFHTLLMSDLDKVTRLSRTTLESALREQPLTDKTRQLLSTACLLLQRMLSQTLQLEKAVQDTVPEHERATETSTAHSHFERIIPALMKQLQIQSEDCVKCAVAQESLSVSSSTSRSCISAQAVTSYIHLFEEPWSDICHWPDPVIAFLASARLLDVTADIARMYLQQMTQAFPEFHLSKETSPMTLGKKASLALVGMHSFLGLLSEPPAWMNFPEILEKLGVTTGAKTPASSNKRLSKANSVDASTTIGHAVVAVGQGDVERLFRKAVQTLLRAMAGLELSTRVHQVIIVAKQQEEASQETYSPLTTWLYQYHRMFQEQNLDTNIMAVVYAELWEMVLSEIFSGVVALNKDKADLFQRLSAGLLEPDGLLDSYLSLVSRMKNFNRETLLTPALNRVKHLLLLEGAPGEHLLAFYYSELLLYKDVFGAHSHGEVEVAVTKNDNSVQLEVRNAKKLNTIDGVCNSYVLVQFQPASQFSSVTANRSDTVRKRTSPIYDFQVQTSLTASTIPQCSVVIINVMHSTGSEDEDLLLGQAILPLDPILQSGDSSKTRHNLWLLLCSRQDADDNKDISLHSLVTLRRRITSDVAAASQAAIVEQMLDMGTHTSTVLGQQ